jgi:hypothetical protein
MEQALVISMKNFKPSRNQRQASALAVALVALSNALVLALLFLTS